VGKLGVDIRLSAFRAAWGRRPDALVAMLLSLVPFVVFARAFLPGRVLSPLGNLYTVSPWAALGPATNANPALDDVTRVFHPWLLYAMRQIHAGRFPLWNPYEYTGAPFFANPQTAMLFPLTALAFVLPPASALTLVAVLKPALAGVGMYLFLRRALATSRTAAVVGALGFAFGSPLVSWLQWTFASTTMVLPWLLLSVDRLRDGDQRALVALAVVVALLALAGYPQGALHGGLLAAAWALARARGARGLRFLGRAALAATLGVGVAAVQLVAFLDYAPRSAVYAYRTSWTPSLTVPPSAAITLLMPTFFGTGHETWSGWQFGITSLFVGLVPVLTIPAAALTPRRRGVPFFTALTALVAAVHFGVPGVSAAAETPGVALGTNLRLTPLLAFGLAALGALGLDAARSSVTGARALRATFVVLAAAALVAVTTWDGDPRGQGMSVPLPLQYVAMLVLLTAATLAALAWVARPSAWTAAAVVAAQLATVVPLAVTYNPVDDARRLYPTPRAIEWLQAQATHDRVLMPGPLGLLYQLREANGYDGLTPGRIERLLGPIGTGEAEHAGFLDNPLALHGSEPLSPAKVLMSAALDRAAVRYILLPPGTPAPRPGWTVVYDRADARIFSNPAALPRARLALRAMCASDVEALTALRAAHVSPDDVLIDCTPARNVTARGEAAIRGVTIGQAAIVVDEPERVLVRTWAPAPGYLILADTWFPGWTARVDDRETPIARADYAFRAVALPAGPHGVEFRYCPPHLHVGIAASLVSLAIVAALLVARGRRP